jgi:hypothetical protein
MKIKVRQTKIPYTNEEKYQFFVEGKMRVPTVVKNQKKYSKKQRRQNKIKHFY